MVRSAHVIIFTALTAARQRPKRRRPRRPGTQQATPGHLLDQDYLTSTGETVPRPGVPQASGPTPLDRPIERQNNRIDNSICTGC